MELVFEELLVQAEQQAYYSTIPFGRDVQASVKSLETKPTWRLKVESVV